LSQTTCDRDCHSAPTRTLEVVRRSPTESADPAYGERTRD